MNIENISAQDIEYVCKMFTATEIKKRYDRFSSKSMILSHNKYTTKNITYIMYAFLNAPVAVNVMFAYYDN